MARKRARARSVTIPPCADPARRKMAAARLYTFGLTYFSTGQDNLVPYISCEPAPSHEAWANATQEAIMYGLQDCRVAPRGGAKTTWVKIGIIWAICEGHVHVAGLYTPSLPQSIERLECIKNQLLRNEMLCADYPEIVIPLREAVSETGRVRAVLVDGLPVDVQWGSNQIVLPTVPGGKASGATVNAVGLEGGIRGSNILSARMGFAAIDDWMNRKDATSDTIKERIRRTVQADIGGTGSHAKPLACIALCTVIERGDLSEEFSDRNLHPEWRGIREQALPSMPEREDLWTEYMEMFRDGMRDDSDPTGRQAHQFYLDNRADMDRGAVEWWPAMYIRTPGPDGEPLESSWLEHIMRWRVLHSERAFWSECQNEPLEEDKYSNITPQLVAERLSGMPHRIAPEGQDYKLVQGIDVRMREIHYQVVAAAKDSTCSTVDYGIRKVDAPDVDGTSTDDAVIKHIDMAIEKALRERLAEIRSRFADYRNAADEPMEIDLTLIDAGWHGDAICRFCRQAGPRWRPTRGCGRTPGQERFNAPHKSGHGIRVGNHWYSKREQGRGQVYHLDADYWKLDVHERFLQTPGTPGAMTLFGTNPKMHLRGHFAHHICAEEWDIAKNRWEQVSKWNHFLDTSALCMAALEMVGVRLPQISEGHAIQVGYEAAKDTGGWRIGRE